MQALSKYEPAPVCLSAYQGTSPVNSSPPPFYSLPSTLSSPENDLQRGFVSHQGFCDGESSAANVCFKWSHRVGVHSAATISLPRSVYNNCVRVCPLYQACPCKLSLFSRRIAVYRWRCWPLRHSHFVSQKDECCLQLDRDSVHTYKTFPASLNSLASRLSRLGLQCLKSLILTFSCARSNESSSVSVNEVRVQIALPFSNTLKNVMHSHVLDTSEVNSAVHHVRIIFSPTLHARNAFVPTHRARTAFVPTQHARISLVPSHHARTSFVPTYHSRTTCVPTH